MTKPCHPDEVIAVLEVAVRRHRRDALPGLGEATAVGELMLRPDVYQVYVRDQSAELTPREFELLWAFAESPRLLRREEVYERVWGYAMARGDRSVDVYVQKLRHKLRVVSPGWQYLHTHFGVGYRLDAQPLSACAAGSGGTPGVAEHPSGQPERFPSKPAPVLSEPVGSLGSLT
jgi:DNA-binding response OmpR family regulator